MDSNSFLLMPMRSNLIKCLPSRVVSSKLLITRMMLGLFLCLTQKEARRRILSLKINLLRLLRVTNLQLDLVIYNLFIIDLVSELDGLDWSSPEDGNKTSSSSGDQKNQNTTNFANMSITSNFPIDNIPTSLDEDTLKEKVDEVIKA